tara:strand:+ start:658 stop:762 length:105 start_codon:yes stop_codon:yes gene_type:complete
MNLLIIKNLNKLLELFELEEKNDSLLLNIKNLIS